MCSADKTRINWFEQIGLVLWPMASSWLESNSQSTGLISTGDRKLGLILRKQYILDVYHRGA